MNFYNWAVLKLYGSKGNNKSKGHTYMHYMGNKYKWLLLLYTCGHALSSIEEVSLRDTTECVLMRLVVVWLLQKHVHRCAFLTCAHAARLKCTHTHTHNSSFLIWRQAVILTTKINYVQLFLKKRMNGKIGVQDVTVNKHPPVTLITTNMMYCTCSSQQVYNGD